MAHRLPDGGAELHRRKALLYQRLGEMKKPPTVPPVGSGGLPGVASKRGLIDQARGLTTGMVAMEV